MELKFLSTYKVRKWTKSSLRSTTLNEVTFFRVKILQTQCVFETWRCQEAGVICAFTQHIYSPANETFVSWFKTLTKDNNSTPYKPQECFRSGKTADSGNAVGYELFVCDLLYQKEYRSAELNKYNLNLPKVPQITHLLFFFLFWQQKVSIGNEEERQFDLI